jgi:hypothetical protein
MLKLLTPDMSRCRACIAKPLLVMATYIIISVIFFGAHIFPNMRQAYFGCTGDAINAIWLLEYWKDVLTNHINLFKAFHTTLQWYPIGINLTHGFPMPLLGILSYPLTATIGAVATANLWLVFLPAISAFSASVLCKKISGSWIYAWFGGYIYGFSSFEINRLLGHLPVAIIFIIPLLVLVSIRILEKKRLFPNSIWLTLLLFIQFLLGTPEVFIMFGFLAFIVSICCYFLVQPYRKEIILLVKSLFFAYLICLILLSPYLFYFFIDTSRNFQQNNIKNAIDLANLFTPSPTIWLGGGYFLKVYRSFLTSVPGSGGYIGIPLLIIIFLFIKESYRSTLGKILITGLIVTLIASIGPFLHLVGKPVLPTPWLLVSHLPIFRAIMPCRNFIFFILALSILTSCWLAHTKLNRVLKYILVIISIIFLLPNLYLGEKHVGKKIIRWKTSLEKYDFIDNEDYKKWMQKNSVVLFLPSISARQCYLQIKANNYFNLANGCWPGNGYMGLCGKQLYRLINFADTRVNINEESFKHAFSQYIQYSNTRYIVVKAGWAEVYKEVVDALPGAKLLKRNHSYYLFYVENKKHD